MISGLFQSNISNIKCIFRVTVYISERNHTSVRRFWRILVNVWAQQSWPKGLKLFIVLQLTSTDELHSVDPAAWPDSPHSAAKRCKTIHVSIFKRLLQHLSLVSMSCLFCSRRLKQLTPVESPREDLNKQMVNAANFCQFPQGIHYY